MNTNRHLEEVPVPDLSNAPLEPWLRGEIPSGPASREWEHKLKRKVRFTDIYSEAHKETRYLNKLRSRKAVPAKPAPEPSAGGSQEWLLEQFQGFLQKLQQEMAERASAAESEEDQAQEPRERLRPVRTPRSDVPMCTARPAELLRAEFSRGRLYFSCPCCRFPAALPVWHAGKKTRCPRCYSAIRTPHPRRGWKTRVLENDVESLLHPERFAQYYNAHRLIPFIGLPRPKLHPSFHLAAVTILLVLLCFWMPFAFNRTDRGIARLAALMEGPGEEKGAGYKDRACRLVEQFLAAENAAAKAAFVRDTDRVAPLMADWYQRQPGAAPVTARSIETSGTGFYHAGNANPVTDVSVELPDGRTSSFTVEHSPQGDRIDWESSVGYTVDFAALLKRGPAAGPQTVRVLAAFDDYYNYDFPDDGTQLCVSLHDPATQEFLSYGYLSPEDPSAQALVAALNGSSATDLRPLRLEVEALKSSAQNRQVKICTVQSDTPAGMTANRSIPSGKEPGS